MEIAVTRRAGSALAPSLGIWGEQGATLLDSMSVPEQQRLDFWREFAAEKDGIKLICKTPNFVAQMRKKSLGVCTIFELKTETPHRAIRARSQDGICFVNIQLGSKDVVFRGTRECGMGAGTMVLYEAKSEYELDFNSGSNSIVIAVARAQLENQVANLGRHLDENFHYDEELVRMLATLCKGILAGQRPNNQAVNDELAASVLSILSAAIHQANEEAPAAPTWGQSAMLHRIKGFVRKNIQDAELDPAKVAREIGITVGYLHKIFRAEDSSLMRFILSERLERCRKDLARSERVDNISQIAFTWGFNDASHFTRSFGVKFGMSPREYRRRALEATRSLSGVS